MYDSVVLAMPALLTVLCGLWYRALMLHRQLRVEIALLCLEWDCDTDRYRISDATSIPKFIPILIGYPNKHRVPRLILSHRHFRSKHQKKGGGPGRRISSACGKHGRMPEQKSC